MQNFVWMCICAFFFPKVKVQSLSSASQRNMKSKKGLKKLRVRGSRSLQAQDKPLSPGETISDFTLINRRLCFYSSGKALKNSAHLPSLRVHQFRAESLRWQTALSREASTSVTPATTGSEPLHPHLWGSPPRITESLDRGQQGTARKQQSHLYDRRLFAEYFTR